MDQDPENRRQDANRQTGALAALALVLALMVAALFLVQTLRRSGQVEDCLMAGRRDCDRILPR